MTRRAIAIAASAAVFCITTNSFADNDSWTTPSEENKTDHATDAKVVETQAPEGPAAEPTNTPAEQKALDSLNAPLPPPAPEPVYVAPPPPPPVVEAPRFVSPLQMKPADHPAEAKKEDGDKDETLRIGALVGVGFPRPFAAEAMIKIKKTFAIGAEYSFLPNTSIADTEIKFHGIAADFRVFPLQGGFFFGIRAGKQWLDTKTTVNAQPFGKYNESMAAETIFVNPRIGYLKTWDNGITLGIDVGVQIPVNPSYTRESDLDKDGIKTDTDKTLLSVANTLGNKTTPTLDLLKVGFLF